MVGVIKHGRGRGHGRSEGMAGGVPLLRLCASPGGTPLWQP